jgi:hypothetical protein
MEKLICCFCETIYTAHEKICGKCHEYKGLMTITDFDNYYGGK